MWNLNRVPVVDLKAIAKAPEEDDQFKNETHNTGRNKIPSGEHLEDDKIPSKIWDNVGSHSSTSRNKSELNSSDDHATMSRQGDE